jgi:hypothetical protein
MFIFQGIDGTYIRFDPEADAYVIDDTVNWSSKWTLMLLYLIHWQFL